ncbi:MAG: helix-turn-helix transcriptional regulator [Thaumarchaeota archaeon]|nr:helix-turn-helix transcriptional regulator [Nitrososphaerota archaeon]
MCSELERRFRFAWEKEELIELDNLIATTILGKWCLDILLVLSVLTSARFQEIRKNVVGITGKVLSRKLAFLEGKGLVERRLIDSRPPRTMYKLSTNGLIVAKLAGPMLLYLRYLENPN